MKIDRHNYEEYFLLYIDNELGVEEKKQVELFVKENPDLEEELLMLQQSRLIPDNAIVFDKKHLLMREENNSCINLNNYEEWLVLYVDDELNEENKIAVEKFAASYSQVQQELALFEQTKLQPEKIAFADKEVLYRKEKITVISMQWWKVAVAAILIIAAGISLYSILHKTDNSEKISGENIAKTKNEPITNPVKPTSPDRQKENTITNKEEKEQIAVTPSTIKESGKEDKQPENNQQLTDNASLAVNHKKEKVQPITSEINNSKITQAQINDVVAISDKMLKENFNEPAVTKEYPQTPEHIIASNTESKKFRGFFRKATRLFERATNINPTDDNNKVLIGGMAINLK